MLSSVRGQPTPQMYKNQYLSKQQDMKNRISVMFLVLADGCQLTPFILKGKHPHKEKVSSRVILEVMRRG